MNKVFHLQLFIIKATMSTISFSLEYLVNIFSFYNQAKNKHFKQFGLYNSRIIINAGGPSGTIELKPNSDLWFKELDDGSVEFIIIIGSGIDEHEPIVFDESLARYINSMSSNNILIN